MPKEVTVTATKKIDGQDYACTIPFSVPENCVELAELWGDEIGCSNAVSSAVITLQGGIRRRIAKEVADAAKEGREASFDFISAELVDYKPKAAAPKVDSVEAMLNKFDTLSPEKQADILKQLKQKAKGKA